MSGKTRRQIAEEKLAALIGSKAEAVGMSAEALEKSALCLLVYYGAMEKEERATLLDVSRTFAIAGYIKRADMDALRAEIEAIEAFGGVE